MSAATTEASGTQQSFTVPFGEWFWRFLAVAMLFILAWAVWIGIQISPPALILPAAYEAAAQGRASRSSSGPIAGVVLPPAPAETTAAPAIVIEPPVNLEKLKLSASIETPLPQQRRRAAKTADTVQ